MTGTNVRSPTLPLGPNASNVSRPNRQVPSVQVAKSSTGQWKRIGIVPPVSQQNSLKKQRNNKLTEKPLLKQKRLSLRSKLSRLLLLSCEIMNSVQAMITLAFSLHLWAHGENKGK